MREATPALESSTVWEECKTSAKQLQKPVSSPTTTPCITLPFSNIKAGCANTVHNPVLALSNVKTCLSKLRQKAGLRTVSSSFPEVPNNMGNNPAFLIHNFHAPGWAFCWDGNGMDNFRILSSWWNPIRVNEIVFINQFQRFRQNKCISPAEGYCYKDCGNIQLTTGIFLPRNCCHRQVNT